MLNREDVKNIAALARVGLSEEEVEKFTKDISGILDWVRQLEEVDVSNVEETKHSVATENVLREDQPENSQETEAIINLFPEKQERQGKVKAIL